VTPPTIGSGPDPDADYPHCVELTFEYDDERTARVVGDAVAVEVGEIDDDRSAARVRRAAERVRVDVVARDLVALRAGVNTWLRLVDTAESVVDRAAEAAGGA
jgi:KEOPS complex subunit Pcc1